MKVCFLITRGDLLGGANVHVRDMAKTLIANGHEAIVLSGEGEAFQLALSDAGVPSRVIPGLGRELSPVRDIKSLADIARTLREISPDILSTHSSKTGILGRIAAKITRTPALFTAHGWAFAHGVPEPGRSRYRTFERLASRLGHRIVTVCEADRELALQSGVGHALQIATVHNGMPDIAPELMARPDVSPPRLIMVARFMPQKDHSTLLQALAGLTDLRWSLELVGSGPGLSAAQALAAELDLGERVSFAGERRDVPDRLAAAQLFLLISNWEGFPRSILEAMRAGLPVIASDVDGVKEAVRDGETGFIVPRGNVEALREKLSVLIESAAMRADMGGRGRRRFAKDFTFEQTYAKTVAQYELILGQR